MEYNRERAADLVLALMHLTIDDDGRAWKSYDWDVMDDLHERGFISNPQSKAKSVVLTEAGILRSEQAFAQYLGQAE